MCFGQGMFFTDWLCESYLFTESDGITERISVTISCLTFSPTSYLLEN